MNKGAGHWGGVPPDPEKSLGFIYLIEDLTTRQKYIGKKNYWISKPGAEKCKSKVHDRCSDKWKESCWKESNWKTYKGSSKFLTKYMNDNPDHEYHYTILKNCRSRGVLSYWECRELWDRKVLESLLPNGEHEYFNLSINAIRFRPNLSVSDETKEKMSLARKGKPSPKKGKPLSNEIREKISKSLIGNVNAKGTIKSEELRSHLSDIGKRRTQSEITKRKCSEAKLGHEVSEETRCKLREFNSDSSVYSFRNICTDQFFIGTRLEFKENFSLEATSIGRVIRGQNQTIKSWILWEKIN